MLVKYVTVAWSGSDARIWMFLYNGSIQEPF